MKEVLYLVRPWDQQCGVVADQQRPGAGGAFAGADDIENMLRASRACDVPALAALLRDDVTLTVPSQAIRIIGRDAVAEFFATVRPGGRLDQIRLVVTRATPRLRRICPTTVTGNVAATGSWC